MNRSATGNGHWSKVFCSVFLLVVLHARGYNSSLHCYRCLSLDCSDSEEVCEDVRLFVIHNMHLFYHFNDDLDACPTVTDDQGWRIAQVSSDACPGFANEQTCTLGRLQVISHIDTGSNGAFKTVISHGTVLGCAKRDLLIAIKQSMEHNGCNMQNRNGTTQNGSSKHSLALEHCSQSSDMCHEKDFCIEKSESVVKTFKDQNSGGRGFEFGLVAGILGTVVILILAVMGASLFWGPLNRAHNFSKHEGSVAITGFSDNNSLEAATSSAALVSDTNPPVVVTTKDQGPTVSATPIDIPSRPSRKSSYI